MNKAFLAFIALIASLVGCVPVDSLNPVYTKKDVIFDESLLGRWGAPGTDTDAQEGGLTFDRLIENGQKGYVVRVSFGRKGSQVYEEMAFHAFLVDLEGHRFLDVMMQEGNPEPDNFSLQVSSNEGGTTINPDLIRVGVASYLEFEAAKPGEKVQAHLRQVHWFVKVIKTGEKLRLAWLEDDVFKRAVHSGEVHLPARLLGEGKDKRPVITATTQELQKFLVEHVDDKTFFGNPTDELQHLK
jgi:hypothetical protein